jgi:hypothetical protein
MKPTKPTRAEFESVILPKAEQYCLEYLSNPETWTNKYYYRDKEMFYDDETIKHMHGRIGNHLVDHWNVKFTLDGNYLDWDIDNTKIVDGYKLIDLLSEGTQDYEGENNMIFWSRFTEQWNSTKKRKGIGKRVINAFHMLLADAVAHGGKKAVKEWRTTL